MIKKIFFSLFLIINILIAEEANIQEQPNEINPEVVEYKEPTVDCLILEDENSIICKFEITRTSEDQQIQVQWISPSGEISRQRDMIVPAGHGSIYDYRYVSGRELGFWEFKVLYKAQSYSTQFELK